MKDNVLSGEPHSPLSGNFIMLSSIGQVQASNGGDEGTVCNNNTMQKAINLVLVKADNWWLVTGEWWEEPGNNTWIRIDDDGSDGKEELRDGHGGAPSLFENAETEIAGRVDVAMVNPGFEAHLQRPCHVSTYKHIRNSISINSS